MSITPLPLSLVGLPDDLCFEGTFAEALKAALENVRVLVPSSITNVVVSSQQPTDSQRDFVWFRLNNAGNFVGIYIYAGGDWQQVSPAPNQLFWIYGAGAYPDSNSPPPGYLPANDPSLGLDAGLVTAMEALWYPAGPGPYTMYQAVFVGF